MGKRKKKLIENSNLIKFFIGHKKPCITPFKYLLELIHKKYGASRYVHITMKHKGVFHKRM